MSSISDIFASSSSSENSSINLLLDQDMCDSDTYDMVLKEEEDKKKKEAEESEEDKKKKEVEESEEDKKKKENTELEEIKRENSRLKTRITEMEEIMSRYEKTLDIFEKEKNGLEDKLYSKFLPVLNAKKEEILRLQKLLSISRGTDKAEVDYGEDVDTDVDEDEEGDEACESKRQKL